MEEQERAELVAYLDGELDEEATRRVETKVNVDPTVRAELESLRRTWEMLDFLPTAEPSESFTHQTIHRLPPLPVETQLQPTLSQTSTALKLVWCATLLVAGALGFAAVSAFMQQPTDKMLVRELRLIEHYRLYRSVEDLELLKELDSPDLFGSEDLEH